MCTKDAGIESNGEKSNKIIGGGRYTSNNPNEPSGSFFCAFYLLTNVVNTHARKIPKPNAKNPPRTHRFMTFQNMSLAFEGVYFFFEAVKPVVHSL